MANVQITQLPTASALTGTEAVPVVQNGVTVQTTTGQIASATNLSGYSFLTATSTPALGNSRYLASSVGIGITDGGAGQNLVLGLNGISGQLEVSGNGFQVKSSGSTLVNRTIAVSGNGIAITNGNGVAGNPTISISGVLANFASTSGVGLVTINGTTVSQTSLAGTSNQISVSSADASSGSPTIAIANNPVLPGTGGVQVPVGATGNRISTNGVIRYNTTTSRFEGYQNSSWANLGVGDGTVTSVAGTSGQINVVNSTTTPVLSIANNPVLPGTQAVTVPSGTTAQQGVASNGMFRFNTDNSAFEGYSSGTWRTFSVSGGVSSFSGGTTGLSPTTPTSGNVVLSGTLNVGNGGTGATTLTGYLVGNGSSAFTAVSTIPNAGLTNSSVTINGTVVSLGASATVTATATNALTIGTGLTGSSYNGSTPVTIAIDSSVVTLTGTQTLSNKTLTSPVISTITNGGTLTLPTSTDTLVGRATTDTLTNKSISGSTNTLTNIGNSSLTNSSITLGTTAVSLGATASTVAGLTSVAVTQDPTTALQLATKQYVDAAVSNVNYHAACEYATTADLGTVTYNNGSSGVGATITKTSPFATLAIDGANPTVGQRILVKNETSGQYNGIYTVTSVGSGSVGWVLTRATDYDQTGTGTNEVAPGDTMFIISGTVNASTQWVQTTDAPITIGTTPLVFAQIAGPGAYSAGTGLTLTGTQFSISNTAVSANSYGTASAVGSFTVNAQGQLTAASNVTIAIAGTQITSGIVGTTYGGTGLSSFTSGGALYATSTSALTTGTLPITAGGTGLTAFGTGVQTALGQAVTGTGGIVLATSPTLVTPALGTPSAIVLTNATNVPVNQATGVLPSANGGTGVNNGTSTLTMAGSVTHAGTYTQTFTATANTSLTLPTTGTLATLAGSETLTNKTINGSNNTITNVSLTTGVTGTLPIANGGTGQTTASTAFNALSPITSTGDLIIGNGTNSATRLAIGTSGYVLTSNGTTASWQSASSSGVSTFSAGTTGLTPSTATSGAVTLAGTLSVANGGTGVTTTPTNGQLLIGNGTNYTVASVSSGTGISTTVGAGSLTINNTGVTSNVAGTGISVSGATGAVTITNSGVTSLSAGTGISVSGSTGGVTVTNGGVTALTGTSNQISVSASTGSVTLSTPQSIGTASSVQFGSFGVGTAASGTTGEIRATNNVTAYYSSDIKFKENILDVPDPLSIVRAIGSKLYDWKDEYIREHGGEDGYFVRKSDFGVIAQMVERVFSRAVRTRPDGSLAVDYEKLGTLSFGAIDQLAKRIEALENK